MGRMKNPFGFCFGGGKKGRRSDSRKAAQEIPAKQPEEEEEEETQIPLRYPLFDPRAVKTRAEDLGEAPLSRPASIPVEMTTRDHIELPEDEEENGFEGEEEPEEEVSEKEAPDEIEAPSPREEEAPDTPPMKEVEEPHQEREEVEEPPEEREEVEAPPQEREEVEVPPRPAPHAEGEKLPTPPGSEQPSREASQEVQLVNRDPVPVSPPPKAPGQLKTPSPERVPIPEPREPTPEPSESTARSLSAASLQLPEREPPHEVPVFAPPPAGDQPQMSAFEKLENAREGSVSDSLPTAPHTPRGRFSDDDMARRLQAKLAELETLQTLAEVTYYRQKRRTRCRMRPRWVCVEKAIDFYADAHEEFTARVREKMNVHQKKDCWICRDFDFSDIPVLQ
ncbi:hypothetical protein TGMAS_246940 [Toxoplasma gondii MAS]|uniref:Uncharacterized protein n=2 Tax=Toxoplasma gondii TaxID=5811 RepID=A0A086QU63_TOXGO|nr:hypothetical protein TGMAS_246940 [Toxoplasma gondii MAS]PUA90554.1 hypothetical protein TGBR9_246940 [Toxoplasma gondii TgCATBr9]